MLVGRLRYDRRGQEAATVRATVKRGRATVVLGATLFVFAACAESDSASGSISLENGTQNPVSVVLGTSGVFSIDARGGALVPADECVDAPVLVNYGDGRSLMLEEELCPGQTLRISSRELQVETLESAH